MDSPLKWHGGKSYLAKKIVELMPPRKSKDHPDGYIHYCEPYAGGLSVLLANDPEGISEVVNDKNAKLTHFWNVLKSEKDFNKFLRIVQATPFSEAHYEGAVLGGGALRPFLEDLDKAVAFFIHCRQSLAGRMKSFAPLSRTRVRRGMNEQASAWLNAIEGLPEVHERMKRVVVLNHDALDVIREQDGPQTLFYLDPTYLKKTRTAPEVYQHEMTEQDHVNLLDVLGTIKGKFILSGYPSNLYRDSEVLYDWRRVDWELPNNAAGGDTKRRMTESVWMNY